MRLLPIVIDTLIGSLLGAATGLLLFAAATGNVPASVVMWALRTFVVTLAGAAIIAVIRSNPTGRAQWPSLLHDKEL